MLLNPLLGPRSRTCSATLDIHNMHGRRSTKVELLESSYFDSYVEALSHVLQLLFGRIGI